MDEGAEHDGEAEPHVLLAGGVEQPVGPVAGLVEDAREDPGAGRAEQPDEHVAGDPGGPPEQALHGEHQVDEEDREDPQRPPATAAKEQPAPISTAKNQVWVRVRWPPLRRGSAVLFVAL